MEPAGLLMTLRAVVSRYLQGVREVGVAYSGGLDSSLVAKICCQKADVVCYTCAAEGSLDSRRAFDYARGDGFDVRMLDLTEADLPFIVARVAEAIRSTDAMRIAYTIPAVVVLERCEEACVLAGNGADEIFAGYEKYTRQAGGAEREMEKDLKKSQEEAARLEEFARTLGKKIIFPFLNGQIVAAGRAIPVDRKVSGESRKLILQEVGKLVGLSAPERPKKAAQYSSGSLRLMRTLARRERLTLSEWTLSTISGFKTGKH